MKTKNVHILDFPCICMQYLLSSGMVLWMDLDQGPLGPSP